MQRQEIYTDTGQYRAFNLIDDIRNCGHEIGHTVFNFTVPQYSI